MPISADRICQQTMDSPRLIVVAPITTSSDLMRGRAFRARTPMPAATPMANGACTSPTSRGLKPRPYCNAIVSTKRVPAIDAWNNADIAIPVAKARSLNSAGTSIAEPTRRSLARLYRTVANNSRGEDAMSARHHAGQPSALPSTNGTRTATKQRVTSSVPATSSVGARPERVTGRNRNTPARSNRPNGRFTRKIMRQPRPNRSASINRPPISGPATAAAPPSTPKTPRMATRSRGRYSSCTMLVTCGVISAAVAPCAIRATTSCHELLASPQISEVTMKPSNPTTSTRRYP